MKRSTKRLISILICLAMALAILPAAAFADGTTRVFCQTPDSWTQCYIHYWGSGETTWPGEEMSKDENGIWFYDVPTGAAGLVINDGGGSKSLDQTVPTDDNVMFVFTQGTWTTYGKIDLETNYYVAGTDSLCGVAWQPAAAQNKMTQSGGVYTITYTGVSAGSHEFKVTDGTWGQSWGKDAGKENYSLSLTEASNTVEIQFDPAVPSVKVLVNGVDYDAPPPVDNGIYYVAGNFNGWVVDAGDYKMNAASEGVYEYTMTLDSGDYALKVTSGTWTPSWGGTGADGNFEFHVANDGSTVKVTFTFATQEIAVSVSGGMTDGELLLAQDTVNYASVADAWDDPYKVTFIPAMDGIVKIDFTAVDPGYWVEVNTDGEPLKDYLGNEAETVEIPVSAGVTYDFYITPGVYAPPVSDKAAGSVTFKITSNVAAGEAHPGEGGGSDDNETTEENPQPIIGHYGNYIEAGQTMWFVYDNTEHMMNDGAYTMMLYISAGVPYAVTYHGADVPVDAAGFVVYEMVDMAHQGKYVFSVTNNGSAKAFFDIQVKDRPDYIVSDVNLNLGDNTVVTSTEFAKTLYKFEPTEIGVYTFAISSGAIGNWGNPAYPVDNTGTKDKQLQWTCSAVGQNVLIGVTATESAVLTITRTGDYVEQDNFEETVYENTYDFTYQIPENAELVPIDVLDDQADVAVLDKDGFYRYGSKYGPLMVTDLNDFPIPLEDAYSYGQLRAYLLDENGNVIAKNDYNEAMMEYLEAGLVPVTEELAMMLQRLGDHHQWWVEGGFVFEDKAPADPASAWMVSCSYIKGSELDPEAEDEGDQGGSNNQGGNGQGGNGQGGNNQSGSGNQGGTGSNPKTTDISMAWAMIAMILSATCLVVLKKKESFFLN